MCAFGDFGPHEALGVALGHGEHGEGQKREHLLGAYVGAHGGACCGDLATAKEQLGNGTQGVEVLTEHTLGNVFAADIGFVVGAVAQNLRALKVQADDGVCVQLEQLVGVHLSERVRTLLLA